MTERTRIVVGHEVVLDRPTAVTGKLGAPGIYPPKAHPAPNPEPAEPKEETPT